MRFIAESTTEHCSMHYSMPDSPTSPRRSVQIAMASAALLIAHQVTGKSIRDALFLSNFDIAGLPAMVATAALVSGLLVLRISREITRRGPLRVVRPLLLISALLVLVEWVCTLFSPPVAAVLVFVHISALGPAIISGYWSTINEHFNPRTARRQMGWIGGGATFGGILGGVGAAVLGPRMGSAALLPSLAILHLFAALLLPRLGAPPGTNHHAENEEHEFAPLDVLRKNRYIRDLGMLVLLLTTAATIVDYVFKAEATSFLATDAELIGFFAWFYTGVSLASFLVQVGAGNIFMRRVGLVPTVSTLPTGLAGAGIAALIWPGLLSAGLARAIESVLRSSLYRSGYEVLYTPIRVRDKRSTKMLVDVGCDRLGDVLGSALVGLVLVLALPGPAVLMATAVVIAVAALWTVRRLHGGYRRSLETSLRRRAVHLAPEDLEEPTTRTIALQTMNALDLAKLRAAGGQAGQGRAASKESSAAPAPSPGQPAPHVLDTVDAPRIRHWLEQSGEIDQEWLPRVIQRLAWDEVAKEAAGLLQRNAAKHLETMIAALGDPGQEFAVRRRLPAVLETLDDHRSIEALLEAAADRRFEVRYRCGQALTRIQARAEGKIVQAERVYSLVRQEVTVDRAVWQARNLIDPDETGEGDLLEKVVRDRSNRALNHVFNLLSLVLAREPLRIAFQGLHNDDPQLRGTAIEYLELTLPSDLATRLWHLQDIRRQSRSAAGKDPQQALNDLLASHQSMVIELQKLRNQPR